MRDTLSHNMVNWVAWSAAAPEVIMWKVVSRSWQLAYFDKMWPHSFSKKAFECDLIHGSQFITNLRYYDERRDRLRRIEQAREEG